MRLHHVQVSCPPGGEGAARRFWADGLGLVEVAKPAGLAGRGGAWFRAYDADGAVTAEVHVGVEDPCVPARKAHPALALDDPAQLDALAARLESAGHAVDRSQADTVVGWRRFHVADPHGNRVEVLCVTPEGEDRTGSGRLPGPSGGN